MMIYTGVTVFITKLCLENTSDSFILKV